ncbi:methyltransferase domain-containing protein [Aeromicrobium sp. SMF47]|uniref:Methyltransferase domain-containing protein n=1 Tax=Aeromicrobium yanjiei TaxID=2662028 RepID=A0A5Q2MF11_9ACTN|nr:MULTISPECIES: class I SAM-dependent methyltransferase [Aeromicrobium]MRJ77672.1 methyltransferase domain-containing protein [Aeromicrobium yanjiei]MRK02041.1 methyltransferase domain-containing protein [Aeromicrobium sp. S22]QGG41228.1 methyltransferase domain-containing protein [Aeromicrobium yanjiei]
MSEAEPMVDEFDTVAWWTASAVEELGEDHALPAACRGSGSPAGLDWLATSMGLEPGMRLLDSGAGVGGPAEYVARGYGVRPVLAEPMEGACRAAVRLFDHPTTVADGLRLPFADETFDAAWSLGVLCTIEDKRTYLEELRRSVVPGGAVGLLVYTRGVESLPDQPEGNSFPSRSELLDHLAATGLTVVAETPLADVPATPDDWDQAATEVEQVVERDHRDDERWQRAESQQETIVGLIRDELVVGLLLTCRRSDTATPR